MVAFTDSDPVAVAINTSNSSSPQKDCLVRWLEDRHPGLQMLEIHISGVSNVKSDALSRSEWHQMVAGVRADGVDTHWLRPSVESHALIEHALTLPQRSEPSRGPNPPLSRPPHPSNHPIRCER